jgi:hypothetical protein
MSNLERPSQNCQNPGNPEKFATADLSQSKKAAQNDKKSGQNQPNPGEERKIQADSGQK